MGRLSGRKLALIGPPGSGKSSLARRFCAKHGGRVFDTDEVFTRRYGAIPAFFAEHGEAEFRKIEEKLLCEAARSDASVVSTGGGAVCSRIGMYALRKTCDIVYLYAPEAELARRIERSDRPLKTKLHETLAARDPLYERYADYRIDSSVDSFAELGKALSKRRRNRYDIVLCDSDDTVLDFRKASETSVRATAARLGIDRDPDEVVRVYGEENGAVWRKLERGELTRDGLYAERVKRLSERLGLEIDVDAFNGTYVEEMRKTRYVLDGALEFLDALRGKGVKVYIITNSFTVFAEERLKALSGHVDGAFVSEEVGRYKPDRGFFERVFERLGEPDKSRVIVFGDSESSDVGGGKGFGLDTCLFDTSGTRQTAADYSVEEYGAFVDLV